MDDEVYYWKPPVTHTRAGDSIIKEIYHAIDAECGKATEEQIIRRVSKRGAYDRDQVVECTTQLVDAQRLEAVSSSDFLLSDDEIALALRELEDEKNKLR